MCFCEVASVPNWNFVGEKFSISPKVSPPLPNPPNKSKFDFKSFNPIILLFYYTYIN